MDVSKLTKLTKLDCKNNLFDIIVDSNGQFDLSALPGFNISQASDWKGGTVNGTILTVTEDGEVSYLSDLTEISCWDNYADITADGGRFDLSTLPGFDITRTSDWTGGTVEGTILTVEEDCEVTYSYEIRSDCTEIFTLYVTILKPSAALPSHLNRIEDEAFRGSVLSYFYLGDKVNYIGAYAFADLKNKAFIYMRWHISTGTKKHAELLEKMGVNVAHDLDLLNQGTKLKINT